MYFGIDLGTTNSLIGHGDTLYSGLVSSSVNIKEKCQVDRNVFGENIVSSYKVDMTTGESGKVSVACSSIILKELAKQAEARTGEKVEDVIVSVPAKFTHTQRQAVWKAITDAGLTPRGLINEPTAAALYVCENNKELVVVFDLGGGTFDVTILDSRVGFYNVIATDGNGHLAGDNFDYAIVKDILDTQKVPIRYRKKSIQERLKYKTCLAKEVLQRSRTDQYISDEELGIHYKLTVDNYCKIMKETFTPALEKTKELLAANLTESEKPKLVFVGGSTACPYLKEWVSSELDLEYIECDIAPDYIVARGVAKYAELAEEGKEKAEIVDVTGRLCIEDHHGMSETIIEKNSSIPISEQRIFCNSEDTQFLQLNLYQGDSVVCKENEYIGSLVYDYGEVKKNGEGQVEVEVEIDRNGIISLRCTDILSFITQEVKLKIL